MLVLVLVALACKDHDRIQREATLKQNLADMRRAISAYRREHGRHPAALQDLVPKYLPSITTDPVAQSPDWRVTTEEAIQPSSDFQTTTAAAPVPVIVDVHSSAPGTDLTGVPYANY